MDGAILGAHIAAGGIGLVVGPLAMGARKRRGAHTRAGIGYQVATIVLVVTSLGLVAYDVAGLWWLGVIALATQAAAAGGWWLAHRRPRGWLVPHINLMCGSYISFVTAFLVVNWSSPIAWILPTIVGSPLIARTTARYARRRPAAT